ncbi:protein SIEL isoform X1 [Quercus lobata]|uniref:protein SIEL isoform X1 n=1 Tax=Quercus lobata TaxID=97700 RepID=UPI0012440025|nr:protein SIEL isoform X1 [Quercus lobata]
MPYISVSVSIFKPKLHSLSLSLLMEELVPSSSEPLSPQTLASFRSFIINPSTPQSKISSIFETLTRSLQLTPDSLVLNLLSELASRHSNLSHLVFDSVRSNALLSSESIRLAAESLDALASISNTDPTLSTAIDELDDRLFVSLCFGPSVSVRSWLLRNAERFRIGPYLLLTLFLGFTKDPYPYVRKIALDGLVGVSKSGIIEDRSMINGCYCRAIELLGDMEDQVRSAAIRTVSAWGLILVASNLETKLYWSDDLFVKLCSMGRDMSMVVRVEAFDALGKINLVSEDILLQTLSKRVLAITKEKRSLGQCPAEQFEILASNVAGVLVHGLEDEFYEVRKSACHSLRTLTIISAEFAGEALNLLMDVLNDDSMFVRLEALETMLHMATCGHLKVQGTHMHMFLGTLLDSNTLIRSATRKILKLVKLPNIELFRLSFDSLIENLEKHPQDEADIFSVLFHTGCNHGKFVVSTINEASEEIDQASEGKLGFDSARVAALLVLAISAPLSHGEHVCSIPPRIFSYAVTLLGRISRALTDIMDQNALLAYLSQCSISTTFSATELNIRRGEPCLPVANIEIPNDTSNEIDGSTRTSSQQEKDGASKLQSWTMREPLELAAPLGEFQVEVRDEVMKPINLILAKVKDIWPSIHSGFTNEVLRTLRNFKEELATFTSDSLGTIGAVAFTLQYLQVIKQLAKVWEHFLPAKKLCSSGLGELDLILGKLDMRLRELRSRFTGLSMEQELQILELVLLTCTLRLCKVEICCHFATLKKLSTTVSRVESILKSANIEPTIFISEVGKLLCLNEMSSSEASCNPFMFKELLKHFSLSQFVLCGRLNQIKAELTIPDNDSENPLPFVSRLPVGIPCDITLHNTSNENKLWLRMSMDDESTQFVFLDLNLFGSSDEVRKFTYVAPFYKTPNAISFTLRVCMGMECLFEDVLSVKKYGGPERELTYLCQEREVHLSMISEH